VTLTWSWSPAPTDPGQVVATSTPTSVRWSAGPMPESMSSFGASAVLAATITSRAARTTVGRPSRITVTPVHTPSSRLRRTTRASEPASTSNTEACSLSRPAGTHPADPAPTIT